MPEVSEFLSGFNLIKNKKFSNYILKYVTSTHESIKRYEEYQYHIKLIFKPIIGSSGIMKNITNVNVDYENLYNEVIREISKEHIIYGTRDPYRCTIQQPIYGDIEEDENHEITFNLIGHAVKICRGYNCINKMKNL